MTIEMGERVDEAVKEARVQQCHLWLTRASWERGKGHQDTRTGIRHLSNRILIRLHQHQVQNSSLEKDLAGAVSAQKELPLCSQSVCPPTAGHEETIIRTFG